MNTYRRNSIADICNYIISRIKVATKKAINICLIILKSILQKGCCKGNVIINEIVISFF